MCRQVGFLSLALLASLPGNEFPLRVMCHDSVSIGERSVDAILKRATGVLGKIDGKADIECEVLLSRCGRVGRFSETDGIVDTAGKFKALSTISGQVKIVKEILWCNGRVQAPRVYGGCATPDSKQFVVSVAPSEERSEEITPLVWAHEFGHSQGLSHNGIDPRGIDQHLQDSVRLMSGSILTKSNRQMCKHECDIILLPRMASGTGSNQ